MSGDPAENLGTVDLGGTCSTAPSGDTYVLLTPECDQYTYHIHRIDLRESVEFLRELDKWRMEARIQIIQERRAANRRRRLRQKPTRPSAQLMGVCLNGRGWA